MDTFIFLINFFSLLFKRLVHVPHLIFCLVKDMIFYIHNKGWHDFNGYGIHVYVGQFGASKTSAVVRRAYNLAKRYPQLSIVTNITLCNFPKHTKIYPLHSPQDILNAPSNTLVLIDELGTIFNSRDFNKSKGGIPKSLYQHICQNRHRNLMILGTCQHYDQYDRQLRRVTATVTDCSIFPQYPFSRLSTLKTYDASDYDRACSSINYPLYPISTEVYIQTDKLRSLYDTKELVQTILTSEYVSDDEIIANTTKDSVSVNFTGRKRSDSVFKLR